MNVNVGDVVKSIQALVRARRPVDLRRLADPAVPLDEVLDSEPAARAA
jgi:3-phenylpropionate/trans-cinnamate dioxygenase ferredoxin reductase subunit